MQANLISPIKYRADIDGLRAIAVIAVVLFHFFPEFCSGGFAGVDVFFVISGYLVTSILLGDLKNFKFSILGFYVKRIRRLFPSLIVVLLFIWGLGLVFLLPHELKNLGKHIFSGAIFVSNFILYSESGYFDQSSDLKPLLHLWSLSIEEQFYLLWPIILFLTFKLSRISQLVILTFITLLSFGLNLVMLTKNPSLTFYFLPTRLWELATGGVLVFLPFSGSEKKTGHKKLSSLIFGIFGFSLIILSFSILNKDVPFPGFFALLPVVGTGLLIFAGSDNAINKLLANRVLVYVGLISYPLYLWHWPLLSISRTVYASEIPSTIKIGLLILSFLLALLTYEYIEKPIRNRQINYRFSFKILGYLFAISILGLITSKNNGFPQRYPQLSALSATAKSFHPDLESNNKELCRKNTIPGIELCSLVDAATKPTVALVGDSHAGHLFPGLRVYYEGMRENLLLLGRSGTPPLFDIIAKRTPDSSLQDVLEYIVKTDSIHTIILSAYWGSYYEEKGIQIVDPFHKNHIRNYHAPDESDQKKIFNAALSKTLEKLNKANKKVIFFYDIPTLPFYFEKCRPRPYIDPSVSCTFSEAVIRPKQFGYRSAVEQILATYQGITVKDPVPIICKDEVCRLIDSEGFIYADEHHLSVHGSIALIRALGAQHEF